MNTRKSANKLASENSPYLLQHAFNPVNWYPWGEEALNKAREENKLIVISIGYAACHWCHVMAHESFEDSEVARITNENYIAIKVDREERPDIDQVYMNAVQLLTGSGGWPLNIIAMPDGRPIYGGTYFPKERWIQVLKLVSEFVSKNPGKAEEQAESLTNGVKSEDFIPSENYRIDFKGDELKSIFQNWKKSIDTENGGNKGAPKFPLPAGHMFLLHYNHITGDPEALQAVTNTLNKMALGGIYDHLGGGFARYSTDAEWKVPHFEKMLYDNSQLVTLYSFAYQATKDPLYKDIVYESLRFIERELTSEDGGFYSSIDADSEGEEGAFYVWTKEEVDSIVLNDALIVTDYFNITGKGNWEKGKNILFRMASDKEIMEKYNITPDELYRIIKSAKEILFRYRSEREHPGTDDKILTGWNALMLKAYSDAYRVFGEQKYLEIAIKNGRFILEKLKSYDNRLDRSYKNGKKNINAFLDDYAFTIDAFISLYQATFDESWLTVAEQLAEYTLKHFFEPLSGLFHYTSDLDPPLIARKMEINDNVIPSSNSAMAKNLYMLGKFFYNDYYIEISEKMAAIIKEDAIQNGPYYANWDILIAWFVCPGLEVAIAGDNYENIRKEFDNYYLPNVLFSGGKEGGSLVSLKDKFIPGQTKIYVCRNRTCKLPVTRVEEAMILIREKKHHGIPELCV
jgi:uncharacterized protein